MGLLYRSIIMIERKDKKKEVALVLRESENETLVAIFSSKLNKEVDKFMISAAHHSILPTDLAFQNEILVISKDRIASEILFKLPFKLINAFVEKLKLESLLPMKPQDYKRLLEFLSIFYKRQLKEGFVISIKNNDNYEIHFINAIKEETIETYQLKYDPSTGLSIKDFEKKELPYTIHLIDYFYLKEQESQIRSVIESKTLKLISGKGLKKWNTN